MCALAVELMGVWQCRWNAERFIIFHTVILQRARHLTDSSTIRRRIDRLLDAWEAGDFGMMAEDTARTCIQYLTTNMDEDSKEHRAKIFHRLVIRSNLCSAVRWITDREKGGISQPGDICSKAVNHVMYVLCLKHSRNQPMTADIFKSYRGPPPAFVSVGHH